MSDTPAGHPANPSPDDGDDPVVVAAIETELAANHGRINFARFMELALYHPERGYYLAPERRPGRDGDFLTAPETHPFFGMTLARQLIECWERLGCPEQFTVREEGAGVGGLAYDIMAGLSTEAPALLDGLDYRLVEANRHRRADAEAAMRSVGLADRVRVLSPTEADAGAPIVGVVLANEVADALPVHRLVWRNGALRECWVTATSAGFSEVEAELSAEARAFGLDQRLAAAGIVPTTGDRFEISPAATTWFARVARRIARGYTLIIDYGYRTAELYRDHRLAGTLRAYHRHTVDDDPFRRIGRQDLTAHVDFGAVIAAGESVGLRLAGFTRQGEFLAGLGLGELIVGLQRDPALTAADYLATQAAVLRLIDPGGMGRFGVLMMARDAPVDPPLRGFRERGPLF